ncbi:MULTISPECIES: TetR/AcrR family transcriptional regulator [Xanthomonas]|uniref:TetR/AcrR family transcriptional regulator n=1 Tax=Xanthomonas TaxID=338 RepID=UPI0002ECD5CD|nr:MULTISPECIES: TetR/AcrR family transcriptional regulator [Xanthomonas]OOW64367.1 TetR family transcriptional regulator [Xanthomonas campestris pv. thespesiae]OOW81272.1 TetR family transcriptional regulator [Xanthomonas campestris pv. leeana]AOL19100.1 TetR family transcriptional regulator [Xanthomonas citri pv. malvacearum]ASN00683.1 TetR family transcriptional regulator [Xanthomonas citri pv. malvacearum]ASN10186.1 TetR family transcriptional regulator [Xanthomonas citri pv. malvacearum]
MNYWENLMRVRTEEKREAIVQAASEVFLELGFEGASMSQIAARVGGSKRTLYGYFPSKEELFVAVAKDMSDRYFDPLLHALSQSSGPVDEALQRFGEDVLTFLCAPPNITSWQTIIGVSGRSAVGALYFSAGQEEGIQRFAEYLQAQVDCGLLHCEDTLLAAHQYAGLLESETLMPCLFGALKDPTPEFLREATRRAVQTFLAAYGGKAGKAA